MNKQHVTIEPISRQNGAADMLLELCSAGDWKKLGELPVLTTPEGAILATFNQDKWVTKGYVPSRPNSSPCIFDTNNSLPRELINQMKAICLVLLYNDVNVRRIDTIVDMIRLVKDIAHGLADLGIHSFEGLDREVIYKMHEMTDWDSSRSHAFDGINAVWDNQDALPFCITSRFTHFSLNLLKSKKQQFPVIPIRLYLNALHRYTERIKTWYPHKAELQRSAQHLFDWEQSQIANKLSKLRNGQLEASQVFAISHRVQKQKWEQCVNILKSEGLAVIDHGRAGERWLRIIMDHAPSFSTFKRDIPSYQINGEDFSPASLKYLLKQIQRESSYLIIALSGMRSDELLHIKPNWGAQSLEIPSSNGSTETIYLFHTGTNKITLQYQGKDDVFVTTKTGYQAFQLLDAINTPLRAHLPKSEQHWMLCNMTHTQRPSRVQVIQELFRRPTEDEKRYWLLEDEDLNMLSVSDPHYTVKGPIWNLTPHQLRRSLAYYLVGFELADFPQLQQQFSHYSMAMTIYYARNASSFRKMHQEIQAERIRQQAAKCVSIFQRLSDGERLAGGKGRNLYREYLDTPIPVGYKDRRMTQAYWEHEIKSGRHHFHAIAPGMYCTNRQCKLRMEIDLSECVDCEFDIIEKVNYAETARQEAMRMLLLAEEQSWLEPTQVSRDIVRIHAAESIMADLDVPFTPFKPSKLVESMLIPTRTRNQSEEDKS
ncbi:hypothetical protein CGG88_12010 [Vibrio parahaemolyticus]|uniref:hypothetical protein n=1 Tax=Vibrio parahaemolyticus TaxID=670 RepID=UPI001120D890|nr:hypothetical protein [Vibrio parahaemolyticus]TOQ81086.1 hypothetical protein CGG88_12010 [Vibrio parahaemolyticus]